MSKSARSQKSTTLATYPFSGMATLIHSKCIRILFHAFQSFSDGFGFLLGSMLGGIRTVGFWVFVQVSGTSCITAHLITRCLESLEHHFIVTAMLRNIKELENVGLDFASDGSGTKNPQKSKISFL